MHRLRAPPPILAALLTVTVVHLPTGWGLIAASTGEADNHHKMLWVALQQALDRPGPWSNLPDGLDLPLMDPVNLPLYAAGAWLDPTLGYNLVGFGNGLLAFFGAWALARALEVPPWGAVTAGVAAASAPFLAGATAFGITEALPVGWIGLFAAASLHAARSGRWGHWTLAGLALAAFVGAGWYHAVFGLIAAAVVSAWALRRAPVRRTVAGLLVAGGVALIPILPRFLHFLALKSQWADRWSAPGVVPPGEGWRHTPLFGTDLLNLVLPAVERVPVSKSVYLGLVALGLALAAGRSARWLWAACAPLWILALGPWLRVAGHPVLPEIGLPALWLTQAFPALEGLSHWHRAAGPATVFLAVAAGLGAARLAARWPRTAPLWPALLLIDALAFSQTPWPRPAYDPRPPAALMALEGPGALVQLPFNNGRTEFGIEPPRIYDRWQPFHGRPITENDEGRDAALTKNRLVAVADALCGVPSALPARRRAPADLTRIQALEQPGAVEASIAQLQDWGVGWVVLHRDRARTPDAAAALLQRTLGPPIVAEPDLAIWAVPP